MKHKHITTLLLVFSLTLLMQCNRQHNQLEGVWKLNHIVLNGTKLGADSMDGFYWEFNDEGGYLEMVAGAKDKGRYSLKDNKLTKKSLSGKKPEITYDIVKLDSTELQLKSSYNNNQSELFFTRTNDAPAEEKD